MRARAAAAGALALLLGAAVAGLCLAAERSPPAAARPVAPRAFGDRPGVAELTALGRQAFADPGLSASGRLACATCHDPRHAFGPGPGAASPFADGDPAHQGTRAIPALRYAQFMPRFTEHYIDDEDGHGTDAGPTGGLTWDGRADSAREQARIPLFAANEMANGDAAGLAARLARSPYAAEFRRAFSPPGGDVFDDPSRVVDWLALALEVYEQAPEFAPFTSKWDRVLAGTARLAPDEARGLALYANPQKGNCEGCHPSNRMMTGASPLFTDAGLVNVGVPRRASLPPAPASAAAAPLEAFAPARAASQADYDLGLCASGRAGLAADPSYCGRFRTPTLRNVAARPSFFHNGALHSLREAVAFYATRDTDPGHWYPRDADGRVQVYDDLPRALHRFVEGNPPFAPLPDGRPRLDEAEVDDIVAFLRTLTDADVQAELEHPGAR